jgi:Ca2+-binding EF-hand superfamily protein
MRLVALAIMMALAARLATAQETEKSAEASPSITDDVQDLLYLADEGPTFIRLHLRVNGKSFLVVWNEFVSQLFNDLDENRDGVLTGAEAGPIPGLQSLDQSGRVVSSPGSQTAREADTNPQDGKTTKTEFRDYLRRNGNGPFTIKINRQPQTRTTQAFKATNTDTEQQQRTASTRLFNQLDRNKNGKLSKAEFAAARTSLQKLDLDDDETISIEELQAFRNPYLFARRRREQNSPSPIPIPIISISSNDSPAKTVRRLLDRYDRTDSRPPGTVGENAKDNKLSQAELGLPRQAFERLDADSNGQLDFDELWQLLRRPSPALELIIRLGTRQSSEQPVEVISSKVESPRAASVRKSADGLPTLVVGKVQIEISTDATKAWGVNTKTFYLRQFKAADTNNNGYLEMNEARQNGYFRSMFNLLDRDGDEKVFEKELLSYLDKQTKVTQSRTVLNVTDQGRNLFENLDRNRDRRLGQHELTAVMKRISVWDEDGDGQVALAEIPHQYRLVIGRAEPASGLPVPRPRATNRPSRRTTGGPLWFRKMDRNQDGDVSRREFLGTRNGFNNLDLNGDGLIDLAEALQVK